jgi:hypothetical protein
MNIDLIVAASLIVGLLQVPIQIMVLYLAERTSISRPFAVLSPIIVLSIAASFWIYKKSEKYHLVHSIVVLIFSLAFGFFCTIAAGNIYYK